MPMRTDSADPTPRMGHAELAFPSECQTATGSGGLPYRDWASALACPVGDGCMKTTEEWSSALNRCVNSYDYCRSVKLALADVMVRVLSCGIYWERSACRYHRHNSDERIRSSA